jgi:hypothetical protein
MFWLGSLGSLCIGVILGVIIHILLSRVQYGGTVVVEKHDDGRIVYTLEIDDDPEQLQYKKELLLRITPEDKSLNRK